MGNLWSSLKNSLCCSHDGTTGGVHQGPSRLQNPPSGSSKSPPTKPPTVQDPINNFKETADTWDIDPLIQAIGQLLKCKLNSASTSTSHTSSGGTDLIPSCASAISSGATFLKFVNEHTQKIDAKESHKVAEEILQQLGQLHWIVGGLSIIAYLLDNSLAVKTTKEVKGVFEFFNVHKLLPEFNEVDRNWKIIHDYG